MDTLVMQPYCTNKPPLLPFAVMVERKLLLHHPHASSTNGKNNQGSSTKGGNSITGATVTPNNEMTQNHFKDPSPS